MKSFVPLLAFTLLGGCATLQPAPLAAVTPQQRVAQLQATIIAEQGHADNATLTAYGRALIQVNDFTNAADVLDQAIDPAAPDPVALNYRGIARGESGNLEGARIDFSQAAAMGNAVAKQNLAKLPVAVAVATPARARKPSHHPRDHAAEAQHLPLSP